MAETAMLFLACFVLTLGSAAMAASECGETWGTWRIRYHCNRTCGNENSTVPHGTLCERMRSQYGRRLSTISGQCSRSGVCEEDPRQTQAFHKLVTVSKTTDEKPLNTSEFMKIYILSNGSSVVHPCKLGDSVRVNETRCIKQLLKNGNGKVTVNFGGCYSGQCVRSDADGSSEESEELFADVDESYYATAPAC